MNKDEFTNKELMLAVSGGHKLYVQDWGNKTSKHPIIFLHGGPGSGVGDKHKTRFDPKHQRVIFFDQRGSGQSTPKGSLKSNTTPDLVEDIERIAQELKLKSFIITGGSWGSFLALAYALKYPKRVDAMVLSGIFTGRKSEIEHVDKGGFRSFFPDIWENYIADVPAKYKSNPGEYYLQNIFGANKTLAKKAAYNYSEKLEGPLLSIDDRFMPHDFDEFDPAAITIELYYLKNGCFVEDGYLLKNAHKLTMPIWLVQGRYDMVCPPITAYELNKKLPNSKLIWTTAGHGNDRPNYDVQRTLLLSLVGGEL